MTPVVLITFCWAVFIAFWFISAFNTKRYVRYGFGGLWIRLLMVAVVVLIYEIPQFHSILEGPQPQVNIGVQWFGAALSICGVAFAIWARVYLGRNWGMPMSLKQEAELVTTGPYAYVRHPIYTGVLLAMLGTALNIIWWVLPFIFGCMYFIYSAKTEEKIMLNEFPTAYPHYMRRTKMLIPFIF